MRARWLTDKYISLMLLVFPLWTGPQGYAAITRAKFLLFALLTGTVFGFYPAWKASRLVPIEALNLN